MVNEKIDLAYQKYAKEHYNTGIKANVFTGLGVVLGSLIISANIVIMLGPANMISAGFNGLTMLIQKIALKFFGVRLPFAPISILFNAFPAYLSFKHVGKRFTVFSAFSVVLISVFTDLIPEFVITEDRLLIAVFGGLLNGVAAGLILRSGACTGGTDFLAMYFSVKKSVNTFNAVLCCNVCLILVAGVLFGMDSALYSIIYQFVSTQTVNFIYKRYEKKTLFIVTEKPQEVADAIMSSTHHGCTIFNSAVGSYSGSQRHVVYTIIGANETAVVRKQIKGTDPLAFINTLNSDSVSGNFFQRPIS